MKHHLTRRTLLGTIAAGAALGAQSATSIFGVAATCYLSYRRPRETVEFVDYCHSLGAAGVQIALSSMDRTYLKTLRERCEKYGMYYEAMVPMPFEGGSDIAPLMAAAKEAGAHGVRSGCLSGRRYETFKSMEEWKAFVTKSEKAMAVAAGLADQYRLPFGMENHKDWTLDEMSVYMKRYGSEYFGCCLDFGNNVALLDDNDEVIRVLAPYTKVTHVKNMAVRATDAGFELSEVLPNDGIFDLSTYIAIVRRANPKIHLSLEMITRDPLSVPCLTPGYYTTFPQREARRLAPIFDLARRRQTPLPHSSPLTRPQQLDLEDANVREWLQWRPS